MEHSWQRRIKDLTLVSLVLGISVGAWWFLVANRDARACRQSVDSHITQETPIGSPCPMIEAGNLDDHLY